MSIYDKNVRKYNFNITKLDSFDLKSFVRFKNIKFVWLMAALLAKQLNRRGEYTMKAK